MQWRTANILFADVKGYSALKDTQMKVFVEVVLSNIARRLQEIPIKYKNTWGDGIVIICDKIEDVCEAALHLKDLFQGFNWRRHDLPKLDIRISIHHGEYLEGSDPFTERPTFCGRSVVTAARIEPVTPPGKIWMTAQAASMLKQHMSGDDAPYFAIDHVGEIQLPKKYGVIEIATLRRTAEPPLCDQDLKEIREAERVRLELGGVVDRDSDIRELVSRDQIRSYAVVIGVVVHRGEVLLVKRNDRSEGLEWMFPSGKKWPNQDEVSVIEKEVMEEAGITCGVIAKIAHVEKHPTTGFKCSYFHMEPGDDVEIVNGDPLENDDVQWVPISDGLAKIGSAINPDVARFLAGFRVDSA
ncbi:putative adenylate/guanylate cyclase [Rhodopseudomonas palustris HaA2]|uniref:Putative adenylate/guanylate cyclase n=1 Tax=Rhodopseudomonas palustris (strain HaA2) TaxID=316058 RepID=Q2ISJ0_RHOP2|nr:adenylate/guanylate cyclase domain-containing protein [Rhodopseudomonas palustris]ABD08820.1 putative adenylate/guanylate cyclase [Rhodopseudomonas palustris HaA2]